MESHSGLAPTPHNSKKSMSKEIVEQRVITALEALYSSSKDLPLANLPDLCHSALAHVILLAREEIATAIRGKLLRQNKRFQELHGNTILIDNALYFLDLIPDNERNETVVLRIAAADQAQSSLGKQTRNLRKSFSLDRSGPFATLELLCEPHLLGIGDTATEVGQVALNAGYRWLDEFCISAINADQDSVIDELYRQVRSALPTNVAFSVWLYVLTRSSSVYVFDKIAQRKVIERSATVGSRFGTAPSQVLSQLAGFGANPDDTSDLKVVIPSDKTFLHDALDGVNEGDQIALPQLILFGKKELIVQPLVGKETGDFNEDTTWLTAAYSVELRSEVEARLKSIRPVLKRILIERSSLRLSIAKRLKKATKSESFSKWGEFTGAAFAQLIKAFVDSMKGGS